MHGFIAREAGAARRSSQRETGEGEEGARAGGRGRGLAAGDGQTKPRAGAAGRRLAVVAPAAGEGNGAQGEGGSRRGASSPSRLDLGGAWATRVLWTWHPLAPAARSSVIGETRRALRARSLCLQRMAAAQRPPEAPGSAEPRSKWIGMGRVGGRDWCQGVRGRARCFRAPGRGGGRWRHHQTSASQASVHRWRPAGSRGSRGRSCYPGLAARRLLRDAVML